MLKKLCCALFLLFSPPLFAQDGDDGMSDECLRCMRDLYRFYYYEIQPNPKLNQATNEKLSDKDMLQMQVVIGEFRKHCSPAVIARVNESLKSDSGAPATS